MIEIQTATVYKAENGIRYLTRAGAINATARARFKKKYPCECEPDVGYRCSACFRYQNGGSTFERPVHPPNAVTRAYQIIFRYGRMLRYIDRCRRIFK